MPAQEHRDGNMDQGAAGQKDRVSALREAFRLLRDLLRGRRLVYILLCIGAGGLFTISTIVAPLLIRRVIGLIEMGTGTPDHITPIVLLFLAIYLLRGLGRYAYGYLSHVVAYQVMHDILTHTYRHVQALSHRYFNDQRTGDLLARNISDVEAVEDFVAHGIPEIALAILGPLLMIIILATVDPLLTFLAVLPLPLASFAIYRNVSRIRRFWRQVRNGLAEVVAQIQDNLSGITEIKLFNQEQTQAQAISTRSQVFRDASISAMGVSMIPGSVIEMAGGLGLILIAWNGGTRALAGELSLANLFLFVSYISFIYVPFLHIAEMGDKLSKAVVSLERISELLQVEPEIQSPEPAHTPARRLPGPDWTVEFRGVHFAYRSGASALCDVSFCIEPGQTVALVGPTGAGKTTVSRLIPRLYDVEEGQVLVAGTDVRDWDLAELRSQVSFVLQEVFLFHGSIRQNLLVGRPEAGEEELVTALQQAHAMEFIHDMPQGLDTIIGERGVLLSGGQRQRISIARALLRDAPILVLDEATSNVDAVTELHIQTALQSLMQARTTLVIAHRLSTIRHAHQVLYMHEGRIRETGTFDRLCAQQGDFARMVEAQTMLQVI